MADFRVSTIWTHMDDKYTKGVYFVGGGGGLFCASYM